MLEEWTTVSFVLGLHFDLPYPLVFTLLRAERSRESTHRLKTHTREHIAHIVTVIPCREAVLRRFQCLSIFLKPPYLFFFQPNKNMTGPIRILWVEGGKLKRGVELGQMQDATASSETMLAVKKTGTDAAVATVSLSKQAWPFCSFLTWPPPPPPVQMSCQ